MAFAGGLGMAIYLAKVPLGSLINRGDLILFSESNTRFLLEVAPQDRHQFEKMMAGVDCSAIGEVISDRNLKIYGLSGERFFPRRLPNSKRPGRTRFAGSM
jgi:phosphoribosylformylglycinamidine synthase